MALLNFQGRFVDEILEGRKKQTIRNFRKYPVKPGETLYLYTGNRTKHSRKLAEVTCEEVCMILIFNSKISISKKQSVHDINDVEMLNDFAKSDGFKSWDEMRKWWMQTHDLPFHGMLIKWN